MLDSFFFHCLSYILVHLDTPFSITKHNPNHIKILIKEHRPKRKRKHVNFIYKLFTFITLKLMQIKYSFYTTPLSFPSFTYLYLDLKHDPKIIPTGIGRIGSSNKSILKIHGISRSG